jgi:hypothetical protein
MALSDATEETVLDHILGTTELVFNTNIFLALGTDATPSKSTFTEVQTPATGGYSRQAVTFAAAAGGVATNSSGTHTFGACSGTSWATIKSFALWTDETATAASNRMLQGPLTDQTKVVGIGDSVTVAAGAISVTAT